QYTYNGGNGDDSTEVYVGLAADVLLSPSLYYYYDFDYDYSTVEASIGYSLPVDAINASLDFSASADVVIPDSGNNYNYGSVGVAIPYALSDTATLTVGVEYVVNDTEGTFDRANDDDIFVGSVGISIGF